MEKQYPHFAPFNVPTKMPRVLTSSESWELAIERGKAEDKRERMAEARKKGFKGKKGFQYR